MAALGWDCVLPRVGTAGNFKEIISEGLPQRQTSPSSFWTPSVLVVHPRGVYDVGTRGGRNRIGLKRASFRYKLFRKEQRHPRRRYRACTISAKGTDDSLSPPEMTLETALKLLGVREGASFDEILGAKKSQVDSCGGDTERISQLEAAYDTLLMQSLSQRRQGKVLDNSIRYADVKKSKPSSGFGGPVWLKDALKNSPVTLKTPPISDIGLQTGVYGTLVLLTYASCLQPSSQMGLQAGAETPGVILAIGCCASLYFLRKQNVKLGKASVITVAGLVAGAIFGGGVESWLRVDIVPLLGVGSPAVIVSEFVLVSLYLSSLYLR